MVYELSVHMQTMRWLNWLHEVIEYDGDLWKRQEVIYTFVKEDVFPFIKKRGYFFSVTEKQLAQIVAREFYYISCQTIKKTKWHSKYGNHSYREEDLHHFNYIFDSSVWESFWKKTIPWCDMNEESRHTRSIVEFAVWTCLDLDASPQTRFVNDLLNGYESDEESDKIETIESYNEYF